jgi:hypothetical protein
MDFKTSIEAEALIKEVAQSFITKYCTHLPHKDFLLQGFTLQFRGWGGVSVGPLHFCVSAITEEVANG